MTDTPIDLDEIRELRRLERSGYVDRHGINELISGLKNHADQITRDSVHHTGAIDVIAYEISALAMAIERAVNQ